MASLVGTDYTLGVNAVYAPPPGAQRRAEDSRGAASRLGVSGNRARTTKNGDATRFAAERPQTRRDLQPGLRYGNGSLHTLRMTGVPVGILPAGTGNLLARALGIPLTIKRAVELLTRGHTRLVDLGCIHSDPPRTFAFAAGVGIDATMVERTTAYAKRRLGVLAYVLAAGAAAMRHDRFRVRLITEHEVIERDAVLTMVANFGSVLNGRFALGPGIAPDDGELDVCVYAPRSSWDAVRMVWRIVRQDYRADGRMYFARVREVVIECAPPRILQADGEIIGMSPVRITVDAGAATLLVPITATLSALPNVP